MILRGNLDRRPSIWPHDSNARRTLCTSLNTLQECRVFNMLEALHPTATGLDDLPAWLLKIAAPFFAAPIAEMFNLSLSSSVVPKQWKVASISPTPKIPKPITTADYRPIFIIFVLSRVMERIVVRDHICSSLQCPPPGLIFEDLFAFRPTGSNTAALIELIHEVPPLCRNPTRM